MITDEFDYMQKGQRFLTAAALFMKKSEFKTSSTPQTNWSHSLPQGTSTPEPLWTLSANYLRGGAHSNLKSRGLLRISECRRA